MLKKIVMAVALIALPVLGAMAQQKFAHMNAQAVIVEMAEYKKENLGGYDVPKFVPMYMDLHPSEEMLRMYNLKSYEPHWPEAEEPSAFAEEAEEE